MRGQKPLPKIIKEDKKQPQRIQESMNDDREASN